jgi:hypothetical protein
MNLDKLKGHIPDTVIAQLPDTIAIQKAGKKPKLK